MLDSSKLEELGLGRQKHLPTFFCSWCEHLLGRHRLHALQISGVRPDPVRRGILPLVLPHHGRFSTAKPGATVGRLERPVQISGHQASIHFPQQAVDVCAQIWTAKASRSRSRDQRLHLWAKHCKPELEVHRQILAMLQHNAKMEALIDEHRDENAFPAEAAKQFKDAAFGMAHLQHMVANHFYAEREDEGGIPWICNIVPKLHMLLHAALQSHCVSPRLLWCFPCEDFMHVSRTLAQNCVRGTKPLQACGKMLEHWRIGMGLQLAEQS